MESHTLIHQERQIHILACRIGYIGFPLFFLLDWFMYPEHKWTFLTIRLVVSAYLMGAEKLFQTVKEKYLLALTMFSYLAAALAVTLICFLSGEGFASPYYAGHFIIMIVLSSHFELKPAHYAWIVYLIMIQHFTWLFFTPWKFKHLMLTLFLLSIFSLAGFLMHVLVYKLISEVRILRGFLPICAKCKQVRDDKGYWNQLEVYFSDMAEIQFSHGICPDCIKKLYPEYS